MPLFSGAAVPPALASLALTLGLSAFERDALLLAVAPQLDARIGVVCPGTDPAPLAQGSAGPGLALLCVASLTPRNS